MSRHEIDYKRYSITIGWDRALNTFFATVFDQEIEELDEPLIWLGTEISEYPEVHNFLNVLDQKMEENGITDAPIPDWLTQTLKNEQISEGEGFKERPTELQKFILKNRKP